MSNLHGFVNILKPVGPTASDMVIVARKKLDIHKIGHLGTLDPGAAGVLPLAIGCATKLFDLLTFKKKKYIAYLTFGKTTDTLDSYGKITETCELVPTVADIKQSLNAFVGKIMQLPPNYSSKSINGKRAYQLAREGKEVILEQRPVEIYELKYDRQLSNDTFVIEVTCSGGTYIRSLVRDIAFRLETVAYMSGLLRVSSGVFDIADAVSAEELCRDNILSIESVLSDFPVYNYDEKYYIQLSHGIKLSCDYPDKDYFVVKCKNELFGVGKTINGRLDLQYFLRGIYD